MGSLMGWKSALLEDGAMGSAFCPAPSPLHSQLHPSASLQPRLPLTIKSSTSSSLFPGENPQVQQSTSPSSFLHHPCQEMPKRNLLDCLSPAGLSFQQGPGWFRCPRRTTASEHQASFPCLRKVSSPSSCC